MRSLIAPTSKASEGQRFWLVASRPSRSSWMVARVFGSKRPGPRRVPMSAFGSSEPAETTPRGRWYLNERPIRWTPLASSAEARVSPARPV